MSKKQFFLIVDTETTINDHVVDFGAVICDRNGKVFAQCGVMVREYFGTEDLFYDKAASGIWSRESVNRRMARYNEMVNSGSRMVASVNAINRWLEKVSGKYNPTLTAYNLAFDMGKCRNTNIDLNMFDNSFCLWQAAVGNICNTKKYREFVLQNHLFNKPTEKGNMTFSTTAESVAGYLNGQFNLEPHTALEDAMDFELPILVNILKKKNWRENITPYDWNKHQVRDHFKA